MDYCKHWNDEDFLSGKEYTSYFPKDLFPEFQYAVEVSMSHPVT